MKKLLAILLCLMTFTACSEVPEEAPKEEKQEVKEEKKEDKTEDPFNPNDIVVADFKDKTTDEYIDAFIEGVEPKTSKMVDVINQASKNSANFSASEEKRDEALNYLRSNYPNYTADDNVMIHVMYYGFYLNHAYGDGTTYGDLGFDASQIAKNVYRGTDAPDSQFVQSNYEQVQELLNQI